MRIFILKLALFFVFTTICSAVFGQEDIDHDSFESTSLSEPSINIVVDESLFYMPLEGTSEMFARKSVFNFSAMRFLRRGYDRWHDKTVVNNIVLDDPLARAPSYQLQISLNSIHRVTGSQSSSPASIGNTTHVNVRPSALASGSSVSVSAMDRAYRFGTKAHTTGSSKDSKWSYSLSAAGRWGRNGHIEGMFTDGEIFSVGVERSLGGEGSISFFGMLSPMKQGLRSATVMEALLLTDDNLYNPSWGYHNGEIRNSKVRETMQPFAMLTYDGRVGAKTNVSASVAYTGGRTSHSGLWWFDGMNPYPDYYRYMPSFSAPGDQQAIVEQQWREGARSVVQVNWNDLCGQNATAADAVYIVEAKVEEHSTFQGDIRFTTTLDRSTTITYGASGRASDNRYFSEAKDALGSNYSGNRYDYGVNYRQVAVNMSVAYAQRRLRMFAGGEISAVSFRRTDNSTGDQSKEAAFSPFTVKGGVGYLFSAKSNSELSFVVAQEHPAYTDIFMSRLSSNKMLNNPKPLGVMSVELNHNMILNPVKLTLTAYCAQINNGTSIRSYYDDLTSVFCNMVMRGVERLYYGVELAASVKLTNRLSLDLIGSTGKSAYNSDPLVDIYSDSDFSDISLGERARIDGYRLGSTPQSVLSAELAWSTAKGWRVAIGANYMADSYIAINPLRRTPRYYSNVGSPERFDEMTRQERLPEAATVNITVMKTTFFKNSRLFVILSVNNLLDKRDIIHDGYEQMRIRRPVNDISGDWTVFPTKYIFGYGRTFFCSVNYIF